MNKLIEDVATLKEQGRYVAKEISEIKQDVKQLLAFKWKIFGATAFIAFVVTTFVEIVRK